MVLPQRGEARLEMRLRDFLSQRPDVTRRDIFICTKVWNHLHEPADVVWSAKNSCENLKVDYIDLFLVHWPIAAEKNPDRTVKIGPDGKYIINKDLTENPEPTWRAMEDLVDEGIVKAIGVSNWTVQRTGETFKIRAYQACGQPNRDSSILAQHGAGGILLPEGNPARGIFTLGSQDQVPSTGERCESDPALNAVAKRSGHSLAQVLLGWGLKRGYVVLPKSSTPSRIESNFVIPELSNADFAAVEQVAKGRHNRFVNMKDTFGYNVLARRAIDGYTDR